MKVNVELALLEALWVVGALRMVAILIAAPSIGKPFPYVALCTHGVSHAGIKQDFLRIVSNCARLRCGKNVRSSATRATKAGAANDVPSANW